MKHVQGQIKMLDNWHPIPHQRVVHRFKDNMYDIQLRMVVVPFGHRTIEPDAKTGDSNSSFGGRNVNYIDPNSMQIQLEHQEYCKNEQDVKLDADSSRMKSKRTNIEKFQINLICRSLSC